MDVEKVMMTGKLVLSAGVFSILGYAVLAEKKVNEWTHSAVQVVLPPTMQGDPVDLFDVRHNRHGKVVRYNLCIGDCAYGPGITVKNTRPLETLDYRDTIMQHFGISGTPSVSYSRTQLESIVLDARPSDVQAPFWMDF